MLYDLEVYQPEVTVDFPFFPSGIFHPITPTVEVALKPTVGKLTAYPKLTKDEVEALFAKCESSSRQYTYANGDSFKLTIPPQP